MPVQGSHLVVTSEFVADGGSHLLGGSISSSRNAWVLWLVRPEVPVITSELTKHHQYPLCVLNNFTLACS